MMLKYFKIILLFFLATPAFSQSEMSFIPGLSDSSRIALLTVSPGQELYSAFGHTGIRITDYKNNFDVVYNYGTFDFEQPGFYMNFVKGKMRYMIFGNRFEYFMQEYANEKRSVFEQELNLTISDKQKIFTFLYNNALPENREYYYDFFWDNCATRPRDVFEKILGNRLKYHTDNAGFEKNKTMHDMLRLYVAKHKWVDYGFDLILGLPCEIIASPRDQTFLPDYLSKYIGSASIDGKPFVTRKEFLLQFSLPEITSGFKPMHFSLILLFLSFVVWAIEHKRRTHFYFFDFFLFFLMGLLGTFFVFLWLFTAHYSVPENLNVLWLIPSHMVIAFLLFKKKKPLWLEYYFTGTGILMILLCIGWAWLPQHFNIAVFPILILLFFRSALLTVQLRSAQNKPVKKTKTI